MRSIRVLALALGLAACDQPLTVITHVDKLPAIDLSDLYVMQDAQGIPVEIHGRPFAGITDEALAAALGPPATSAQGVRFYSRPVGTWQEGHGTRLVLHFNPQGDVPNAYSDCRRTEEARTLAPRARGFSVNASFCRGKDWQAHGFMKAPQTETGDMEEFARSFRHLLQTIFRD